MKRLFRYFELSLAEQRGFIALSILVLCSLSVPYIYDAVRKQEVLLHELTVFEELGSEDDVTYNPVNGARKAFKPRQKINMSVFDPNGLSAAQWRNFGLSEKQVQVIKNYEHKGGRFRKKEDLARIYSISTEDYKRLAPYIKIEANPSDPTINRPTYERKAYEPKEKKVISVNISTADSAEWVALSGIGPVLANRIIKYREALGGFNAIGQIAEVYGLPPDTYTSIEDKLHLSTSTVKKININKADIHALAKHPYISRKQAQWIVNYREQHGFYTDLKSLEGITLLEQGFLRKIEPYLAF